MVEGKENYKNSFSIKFLEEETQNRGLKGDHNTDYDRKVGELIRGGIDLRKRMKTSEQNK